MDCQVTTQVLHRRVKFESGVLGAEQINFQSCLSIHELSFIIILYK